MGCHSIKLKIEPSILKYARFCSGYNVSEVAKKAGIEEEELQKIETDKLEISISKLKKLASVYKMPLAYFLLEKTPKDAILPDNFRVIYSSENYGFTPGVMLAIRNARYVQSIINNLSEKEFKYDFKEISINYNVEEAAKYFRSLIKVPFEEQIKWSDPAVALRNWKNAIEKINIFILQSSLPKENISAFCLADQLPYVVFLNSAEHENRRLFSLFHEIAHILMHFSGICTVDDFSYNTYEYIKIEKFCNQFAASLLVPYEEFISNQNVQELKKIPFSDWKDENIEKIARKFKVSREVIYRRLVTVGILKEKRYEEKRRELIRGFESYNKKYKKNKNLRIPEYVKIISKNGKAYSSFILDNLHSNRITLNDAAQYLNTNSRHISKVDFNI